MRAYERWSQWAGALAAKKVVWGLALLFCVWVPLDIFVFQLSGGVSRSAFDAMVRARLVVASPDPRIVIVDIDESSLKRMSGEFGRWPWPRDTLATTLDYLERQQPAAIVWDILFADADRLSPGGDAAFDAAAARSAHSHFPVVRLSDATDASSAISSAVLPGLWVKNGPGAASLPQQATVAVIPPVLPALAAGRLGYNNGYVDADGVLRRYRALETLADGSAIQSIPMSVLSALDPQAYQRALASLPLAADKRGALIAWRSAAQRYPHIPFADVFAAADAGLTVPGVPDFAGKIILIGSTAASLHDIHPTPLAANAPGVDALATVVDNTVNQRQLEELPPWLQALVAVLLCLGLAFWVQQRKIATLTPFTLVLPAGLLLVSYATLNGSPVFVDLQLSAALALLFLASLRYWNQLRRRYWCAPPAPGAAPLLLWPIHRDGPWLEAPLDHLIDVLERHSKVCRVLAPDVYLPVFQSLRWPELVCHAAILGPEDEIRRIQKRFAHDVRRIGRASASMVTVAAAAERSTLADAALRAWTPPTPIDL
jgi:CHASE2 domain-containing sensor protein